MSELNFNLRYEWENNGMIASESLIVAVVQDVASKEVLMQAFMNREAWDITLETGVATFWSRSRKGIWVKGAEESGTFLHVKKIILDCDRDSVLLLVEVQGDKNRVCHLCKPSCFFREAE